MDEWNEPGSVVSPLLIGYRKPREDYFGLRDAWARACQAVPAVEVIRNIKVSRRETRHIPHAREVHSIPGIDGSYSRRARCVDRADNEQLTDAVNRWTWEVGYTPYAPGTLAPAIGPDLTPVVLEVSRFRISKGAVRGAAQLALFRTLFLDRLRDFDPDLVVFGGQRSWEPALWTLAQPVADQQR